MKKLRCAVCVLLALVMVLALCACGKTDGGTKTDDKSSEGTSTNIMDQGNNDKDKEGVTTEDGITVIQDTVILNMEEQENRPHEIQPGTEIKFVMFNDVVKLIVK